MEDRKNYAGAVAFEAGHRDLWLTEKPEPDGNGKLSSESEELAKQIDQELDRLFANEFKGEVWKEKKKETGDDFDIIQLKLVQTA